jgi:FixJ family two-component response regulator
MGICSSNNHQRPIAIVDDDLGVLNSLKFLLEITGHKVTTYTSPLAFLHDVEVHPACLILDYDMLPMTGPDLAARLKNNGRKIPILLMTASPSSAISARANQLGIEKVLAKPLDVDELLEFVDHALPA